MFRTIPLIVFCSIAVAQTGSSPAGKWVSNLKYFDQNNYDRMELQLSGGKLSGKLGDDPFEGTFKDGKIDGVSKPIQRKRSG